MIKKNIAFVIYSLNSGGAERVVSTLANGLSGDFNVSIITFTDIKPFYELNDNVKVFHCFKNLQPSKNVKDSIRTNFALYNKIKNYSKKLSINLLIGFMTNTNILTILAAKSLGLPVLVSERINPEYSNLPKIWSILRRFTYPKANILIVQTEPIKNFFKSFVHEEKLRILPNPISSIHEKARKNTNVTKENIVLSVGRLSEQKGQELAIEAFAKINAKNWELHIIGEGPKREEYTKLISNLNMIDKIKLIGRNNKISEYYLKAEIFVFPSRFEGFPNALTEAMFLGLPCISTNCPTGPSELIENEKNGFLVEMEDADEISRKIKILIEDRQLRLDMGNRASISVDHLMEDKVVAQWKNIINQNINL
jgi:GalNAc-alpha-(1->4)-GalNAc-alpha-(1->3)-diNAcBac-PP-undecaprenol alpha-1,4-N-acetyl-D-galactosaminyltransferase